MSTTSRHKICVVGAGSSGLAVAKNFQEAGIAFDLIERESDVAGIWNPACSTSSIYRSTHLISSKALTEYTDFPMPASYPEYPSRVQAFDYLQSYARHFQLHDSIEFGRTIERLERSGDTWHVTLDGGEVRDYRGVVIANGHNWDPNWPDLPGSFDGTMLHSAEYKTSDVLQDRRVLVIGAGNSGCDIAVEAAQHAAQTFHSTRRAYHYLPKFIRGKPIDACGERLLRWHVPMWLRRAVTQWMVRIVLGPPQRVGLPQPDHKLFETHPIINSQLYYYLGHGDITPKNDVTQLDGLTVHFRDGSEEAVDVIVCATGFKISFPFIDRKLLNWRDGRPDLFLNIFHPHDDSLFVAGMIQPDSGQWGLVDTQAQLIARVIQRQDQGDPRTDRFDQKKQRHVDLGRGIAYQKTTRHLLEVEHFSYRRRMEALLLELA